MNGQSSKGIYVVLSECNDPSREEEFNQWYTHTHLADVLSLGIFHRAWRYEAATPDTPKYLALYETDAEDLPAAVRKLDAQRDFWRQEGKFHPTLEVLYRSFMATREPGIFVFDQPTPGRITGLLMMGSNPKTPGTDDAFNEWYDNVHMTDLAATGLFKVGHRFEALEEPAEGQARYLNLYETELEEVSRALTGLGEYRQGWIDAGTYYYDRVFLLRGAYRLIATHPAS